MATTAGDQINRALRLIGVLAEGEVPSASTSADALMALNQMLDSWNTESLSVYSTQDQVFTWPANQISQTLGPPGLGANFIGNRPITILDAYYVVGTISYPVEIINQDQYDGIALKTATTTLPQVLFVNTDFPNNSLFLYPVPTQSLTFHVISATELAQPALLSTALSFPPGYLKAFAYNLAVELAPEFGATVPKEVRDGAAISKRNIKRINQDDGLLSMPDALVGGSVGNIFAGN